MSLLPVVILAGGLGTRLRPYTETVPKSLVLINGLPFIDYQLQLLKTQHVNEVLLLIGYLGESIKQYVGDGARYGLQVSYHHEGEQQKGTAGCIESAYNCLPDAFFVLYGDSYLLVDFLTVQRHFFLAEKPALMTIYKNNNRRYANNIDFDGKHIINYNKVNNKNDYAYIDYGLSLFKKTVFTSSQVRQPNLANIKIRTSHQQPLIRPSGTFSPFPGRREKGGSSLGSEQRDLSDYVQQLLQCNALSHYVVEQPFYEVGSIDGINQFRDFIYE